MRRLDTLRLFVLVYCVQTTGQRVITQDITTSRPNTLYDNADDIQRQLDIEARDRMKFGRPKTIWVFHFPTNLSKMTTVGSERYYRSPDLFSNMKRKGKSQFDHLLNSVDLTPEWDYKVKLTGEWPPGLQPLVAGGATRNRRYAFHSVTYHWPSEHAISGLLYPMESQVLHISTDYKSFDDAIRESKSDPLAFLNIINIYTFSNRTQDGVADILKAAASIKSVEESVPLNPLGHFSPPFKSHAAYHGSLTTPPCTESVLWVIRAKSLPIVQGVVDAAKNLFLTKCDPTPLISRQIQPLNDRKIYLFN